MPVLFSTITIGTTLAPIDTMDNPIDTKRYPFVDSPHLSQCVTIMQILYTLFLVILHTSNLCTFQGQLFAHLKNRLILYSYYLYILLGWHSLLAVHFLSLLFITMCIIIVYVHGYCLFLIWSIRQLLSKWFAVQWGRWGEKLLLQNLYVITIACAWYFAAYCNTYFSLPHGNSNYYALVWL